jgi:hypothetical protein
MRYLIRWTLILLVFSNCTSKENRNVLLTAEFNDKGIKTTTSLFTMYSDSTYIFYVHEYRKYGHGKDDIFRGRCHLKGDSIVFFPFNFEYVSAGKARITNNYLEFLGGKDPFKMRIVSGQTSNDRAIDTR